MLFKINSSRVFQNTIVSLHRNLCKDIILIFGSTEMCMNVVNYEKRYHICICEAFFYI